MFTLQVYFLYRHQKHMIKNVISGVTVNTYMPKQQHVICWLKFMYVWIIPAQNNFQEGEFSISEGHVSLHKWNHIVKSTPLIIDQAFTVGVWTALWMDSTLDLGYSFCIKPSRGHPQHKWVPIYLLYCHPPTKKCVHERARTHTQCHLGEFTKKPRMPLKPIPSLAM